MLPVRAARPLARLCGLHRRDPAVDPVALPEETAQSAGQNFDVKRGAAAEHASALRLQHSERIAGKRIILYDDICTTGLQLNAVARRLCEDWGAISVVGVVLARQPWGY